jgi:hypothetical protein
MAELEGRADVRDDLERPARLEALLLGEHLLEGPPVHELHDDERQPLTGRGHLLAGVVDGDDRRMVEGRRVLRLAAEPLLEGRVAGQVGTQHLDGHVAAQPEVTSSVHLGHAAVAQ